MHTKTKYVADDGSEWNTDTEAYERDRIFRLVEEINNTLPEVPDHMYDKRVYIRPEILATAKAAVVNLCAELWPDEAIFKHDPQAIHPFSYAMLEGF